MTQGTAFFVPRPRTIDDLISAHPTEAERRYEVVKVIRLAEIDYENFITDMLADRWFLEENAGLCCKTGSMIRCLLVTDGKQERGVLVVPNLAWVDVAAVLQQNTLVNKR